ncbi:MAG: hypothetical protein RR290_03170 [Clostridia bacterium]
MKNKKGISLIVLVVTIIVIIILAGAVILSLTNNNPIEEANKAKRDHSASEATSALSLYLGKVMAKVGDSVQLDISAETPVNDTGLKVILGGAGAKVGVYEKAGDYKAFVKPTDASAAGYTECVVTAAKLGFATWPTAPGYTLKVSTNCILNFVQNP